jgi:nucleotide-binding universal stress UspA family protein
MTSFRRILVAADFSESSRQAFRAACALARERETRVHVLHVLEPVYVADEPVYFGQQTVHYVPVARDAAELEPLREQMRVLYVPHQPLEVEYHVKEGTTAAEIVRFAQELGCDLAVMGTHGRTGLRRLLTGSVAETVLRQAGCPVLVLRSTELPPEVEPLRVILHATDFSESSASALQVARFLARDRGARLVVLHVVPPELAIEGATVAPEDPQSSQARLEQIRSALDGSDLKYPVEVRTAHGDPASEILWTADELGCGLMVIGTHGRTGLARLLMGSVAEAVLRRARPPVLAVKLAS